MRLLICGLGGHMGMEVARLAEQGFAGAGLKAGVDPNGCVGLYVPCAADFSSADPDVDCIVDFSHHACTNDLLAFAVAHRLPLVIATTGQTEEEKQAIREASHKIPLFFAANFSVGIALLIEFAKKTAAALPDAEIEIVETHHDRKLDAPSGTALAIADALCEVRKDASVHPGRNGHARRTPEEIGIHAVRIGNVAGIHEVLIGTPHQTITLKHEAHDRTVFAEGALTAAAFLMGKPNGLYDMKSMIDL